MNFGEDTIYSTARSELDEQQEWESQRVLPLAGVLGNYLNLPFFTSSGAIRESLLWDSFRDTFYPEAHATGTHVYG
jgi:hypothetical protein